MMRQKLDDGKCSECKFFGVRSSPRAEVKFDAIWGTGEYAKHLKTKEKGCMFTPEEWHKGCPHC